MLSAIACSDATAPQPSSAAAPPAVPATPSAPPPGRLGELGGSLHDATHHFVVSVQEAQRARLETSLSNLSQNLSAGKMQAARASLAEAQALLAAYDSVTTVEIAPVALALEQIQIELSANGGG